MLKDLRKYLLHNDYLDYWPMWLVTILDQDSGEVGHIPDFDLEPEKLSQLRKLLVLAEANLVVTKVYMIGCQGADMDLCDRVRTLETEICSLRCILASVTRQNQL